MSTTNFKVNGQDLSAIFAPYTSGTKASITGHKVGGNDLSNLFKKYSSGTKASNTGIKVNGNDLSNIFAKYYTSVSSWFSLGSTPNTIVRGIAIDNSNNVYIVGTFTTIGSSNIAGIAKWDGTSFSSVGNGTISESSRITCIDIDSNGNIYVGGLFTTIGGVSATNVAKWNGTTWSALGTGVNAECLAVKIDSKNQVYYGGSFTLADGVTNTSYFAKWTGTQWLSLSTGLDGRCRGLAIDSSDNVYFVGDMANAGGSPSFHIGKWISSTSTYDTTNFLGGLRGTNNYGICIEFDSNGLLYIGGFNIIRLGGTNSTDGITAWGGGTYNPSTNTWGTLGGTTAVFTTNAIAIDSNNQAYYTGNFTSLAGVSVNRIAMWNGTTWSALGTGLSSNGGYACNMDLNGFLYVGGDFASAGGVSNTNCLALWKP